MDGLQVGFTNISPTNHFGCGHIMHEEICIANGGNSSFGN